MGLRIDRLFYELELQSRDFDRGVLNAERAAGRFTRFMEKHPLAVTGALAASFVTIGIQSARMAAQLDGDMRKVKAALPTADIDRMREAVLQLSQEVPHSTQELSAALEAIARGGVEDATAALDRLRLATTVADASGLDLITVVRGMDGVLDAFGQTTADAQRSMAALFATAQGKVPLEELIEVLTRSGATLRTFNLDLETSAELLAEIIDAGVPARTAVSGLAEILNRVTSPTAQQREAGARFGLDLSAAALQAKGVGRFFRELEAATGGAAAALDQLGISTQQYGIVAALAKTQTQQLGRASETAAAQLRRLREAAALNRAGAEEMSKVIKQQLAVVMLDLGNNLLPAVNAGLKTLNDLLNLTNGLIQRIQVDTAVATLFTLGHALDNLTGEARTRAIARLREELRTVVNFDLRDTQRFLRDQASPERLQAIRAALEALVRVGAEGLGGDQALDRLIRQMELVKRIMRERGIAPAGAREGAAAAGRPGAPPLTADQLRVLEQAQASLAASTQTLLDDSRIALARFLETARTAGVETNAQVQAAADAMRQNIAALQQTEPTLQRLRDIDRQFEGLFRGGVFNAEEVGAAGQQLEDMRIELERAQSTVAAGTDAWQRYQEAIDAVKQRMQGLADAVNKNRDEQLKDEQDANRRMVQDLERARERSRRLADSFERGARAALQIGEALGFVNDELSQVLQGVVDLASGIGHIAAGDTAGGILQALGGVASILDAASGPSPEDQARTAALKANTEAIELLTQRVGEFALDLTGAQVAGVRTVIGNLLPGLPAQGQHATNFGQLAQVMDFADDLERGLREVGLTMEDLRHVAEELGIALSEDLPTYKELAQLLQAIQVTELTQFARDFTGQLQALRAEFELFDLDDPIKQLERLRDVFTSPQFGAPALTQALAGLDLSTAEGRAAAERRLQDLFNLLRLGKLDAAALGGLTPDEFLQALLDFENTIDQANAAAESAGTSGQTAGFAVQRTITEVTGSRIDGRLLTGNLWLEAIEGHTRATAEALKAITSMPRIGLQPPVLPDSWFRDAGAPIVGELHVHLPPGVRAEDATAIGQQVGEAVVAEIDRQLGRRRQVRGLGRGSDTLN